MGFSVAGAFELAVELGGGIVWVALIVVFGRFSLTLFESVDEIGLGDALVTEKRNAERAGGGAKSRGDSAERLVRESLDRMSPGRKPDRGESILAITWLPRALNLSRWRRSCDLGGI